MARRGFFDCVAARAPVESAAVSAERPTSVGGAPDRASAAPAAAAPSDHVAAVFASFLGWTLDAFDFFLVVMCLTRIAADFRVPDKSIALTLTVTLAFRPLGALVFGLLSDRYGRRVPLMLDLVFYSVVEVLSGLSRTYTTFLVLRALFGIGMGGEWGVGASLAMEKVPPKLRGAFSGLLQQGYALGYLLAALAYAFVVPRWGWRPLFFLGGLPALLALAVRSHIRESEVWERTRHETVGAIFRTLLANKRLFVTLTVLMTALGLASHGTQDMYPTFLERSFHIGVEMRTVITCISMIGAIIGGVLFGVFSDRVGRRRAIVVALLCGIGAVPLWAFAPSVPLLVTGAFLLQLCVQGAWGVVPAHITELSPDSVRGLLPGFAYQCGILLAGTITTVEAALSERMSYAWAMATVAVLSFMLAVCAAMLGREQKGVQYGSKF